MATANLDMLVDNVLAVSQALFDPLLDEQVAELEYVPAAPDDPHVPMPEEEWRRQQREELARSAYDRRALDQLARGFALIDERLAWTNDPERCHRDLVAVGEAWLELGQLGSRIGIEEQRQLWRSIFNANPEGPAERPAEESEALQAVTERLRVSWETFLDLFEIGAQLYHERQVQDAYCVFRFLSTLESGSFELWQALGQCAEQLGDPEQAADCYLCALLVDGTRAEGYYLLARTYLKIGDAERSELVVQLGDDLLREAKDGQEVQEWQRLRSRLPAYAQEPV